MNTKKRTNHDERRPLTRIIFPFLILISLVAQTKGQSCLDLTSLTDTLGVPGAGYNNDNTYPPGSVLISTADMQLIKKYDSGGNNWPFWTVFYPTSDTAIYVTGWLEIDLSGSSFPCKRLTFEGRFSDDGSWSDGGIIIDGDTISDYWDTYLNRTAFPTYIEGSNYTFIYHENPNHPDQRDNFEIAGNFDSIVFFSESNGFSLDKICLDSCIHTCQAGFVYNVNGSSIDFTNTSSPAIGWYWDFGDGNTSMLENPTHTYSANGNYSVCLNVYSSCDTLVSCQSITVLNGITPGCLNLLGMTDTMNVVNVGYNNDTNYPVGSVVVSSGDLKLNKVSRGPLAASSPFPNILNTFFMGNTNNILNIYGNVEIDVSASPFSCKELTFDVTGCCDKVIVDGDTVIPNSNGLYLGAGFTASVVYNPGSGMDNVKLRGSFNFVESYSPIDTISIANICLDSCLSCHANFNYIDTGLTVSFTNLSTLDSASSSQWQWDFGDGNFSSSNNPQHVYSAPGTYQVCLSYIDTGNCSPNSAQNYCQSITVKSCYADFTESIDGLNVSFNNTSSQIHPDNTFLWHFGDGNSAWVENTTHWYDPGIYIVQLSVENATTGCHSYISKSISVSNCVADFSSTNNGLTVDFTNLSSSDSASATQWQWDFGDGNFSGENNPQHVYAIPGTYQVCLSYMDLNCCPVPMQNYCQTITVDTTCQASFTTTSGGLTVDFGNTSSAADFWQWDFGDGGISQLENPSHTYTSDGVYQVCLVTINYTTNCTTSVCQTVAASLSGTLGCLNLLGMADTMNIVDAGYNNDNLYPVGSTVQIAGDLRLKKISRGPLAASSPFPNILNTFFMDNANDVLVVYGSVELDVSASGLACKELTFDATGCCHKLVVNGDTIIPDATGYHQGNGFTVDYDPVSGIDDVKIRGAFNTVNFYSPVDTMALTNVCLDSCSSCHANFTYVDNGLAVDFTNVSSSDSANASQWEWDFGDGNFSSLNNPQHTYGASGTYQVCLSYTDTGNCFPNAVQNYCQVITVISGTGNGCIDIGAMSNWVGASNQGFNNDNSYPPGAVVSSSGDLKLIKTFHTNGNNPVTNFVNVHNNGNRLLISGGEGGITLDMSSDTNSCKNFMFDSRFAYGTTGRVIVDGDTIIGQANQQTGYVQFPTGYAGNGFNFSYLHDPYPSLDHFEISGDFDLVILYFNDTLSLENICLSGCNNNTNCQVSFTSVTNIHGTVSFTNTSSVTASQAQQFTWSFGDGNSSNIDDPSHTYANAGTYEVCLTAMDSNNCSNGLITYCDSITITIGVNTVHQVITPNGDNVDDIIYISTSARIYNRNGFLVRETFGSINWGGKDNSGNDLPSGFYTVFCEGCDELIHVTVIR